MVVDTHWAQLLKKYSRLYNKEEEEPEEDLETVQVLTSTCSSGFSLLITSQGYDVSKLSCTGGGFGGDNHLPALNLC